MLLLTECGWYDDLSQLTDHLVILFNHSDKRRLLSQHLICHRQPQYLLLQLIIVGSLFVINDAVELCGLGFGCEFEEGVTWGKHFKIVLRESVLNWLFSNGIFVCNELYLEFLLELLSGHNCKRGNQLISESFTSLTAWWTH